MLPAANPRVVSVGYAVPRWLYHQRDIFKEFGYPERFWKIFESAGITTRFFVGPIDHMRHLSFQEQQDTYTKEAFKLSMMAIEHCLDGRDPKDIGAVSFSSCTGVLPGPVMAHYIARELGMRPDTDVMNNLFHGCDGAMPGFRRCYNYTQVSARPSLVVSCELSSCTYYPEERGPRGEPDPSGHFELLRAHALFADAASCALILPEASHTRHPAIIDTATYLDYRYLGDLGYKWQNGRLRVVLSRRVPDIAAELSGKVVTHLLQKNGLSVKDINYWIVHPAGAIVLDKIRDQLGIDEEKMRHSRSALDVYGNCSSATVGLIAKMVMHTETDHSGYMMMVNIGPGMTADATLMEFPGNE